VVKSIAREISQQLGTLPKEVLDLYG